MTRKLKISEIEAKRKLKQGRAFINSLLNLGYSTDHQEIREIEEALITLEHSMKLNRINKGF